MTKEEKIESIVQELIKSDIKNRQHLDSFKREMSKKYNILPPSNITLLKTYHKMVRNGRIKEEKRIKDLLKTRPVRSLSGIVNVSVLTKPYPCPGECIYCPNQPGVPQSYLKGEPAVQRAVLTEFNPFLQTKTRLESLKQTGHPTDKIELRIIGGTFSYYPKKYQIWFVKECFRAANEFKNKEKEEKEPETKIKVLWKELKKEQKRNEKEESKIIGITIETRPDFINIEEIKKLRKLGVTRVELGVQSIYNDVLKLIKRGHKIGATKKATKLLKDSGFKVSFQVMPNLPETDFKKDIKMFKDIFSNPAFKPDFLKIYPLALIKETPLYQLYKEEKYEPYPERKLIDLLIEIKKQVPSYCRIQRVIRDIPAKNIVKGGVKTSNLREIALKEMKEREIECNCIRCREIKKKYNPEEKIYLYRKDYEASEGKEIFLSFESKNKKKLYALLRIRIPSQTLKKKDHFLKPLNNSAIIREVHTYGQTIATGEQDVSPQHKGLGKKLIKEAEGIAKEDFKIKKISIIAGVGVRNYFRKLGYKLENTYMTKTL